MRISPAQAVDVVVREVDRAGVLRRGNRVEVEHRARGSEPPEHRHGRVHAQFVGRRRRTRNRHDRLPVRLSGPPDQVGHSIADDSVGIDRIGRRLAVVDAARIAAVIAEDPLRAGERTGVGRHDPVISKRIEEQLALGGILRLEHDLVDPVGGVQPHRVGFAPAIGRGDLAVVDTAGDEIRPAHHRQERQQHHHEQQHHPAPRARYIAWAGFAILFTHLLHG